MARSATASAVAPNIKRKRTDADDSQARAKRRNSEQVTAEPTRHSARVAELATKRAQEAAAQAYAEADAKVEAEKRKARQAAAKKAAKKGATRKSAEENGKPSSKKTSSASKRTATKAAMSKTASNKKTPASKTTSTKQTIGKRSRDDEDKVPPKKARVAPKEKPTPKPKRPVVAKPRKVTPKVVINEAPKSRLQIFVFGEGGSAELGLGSAEGATEISKPRYNTKLAPDTVGVVQLAPGAMHGIALTHDNQILTWGNNDGKALGRINPNEGVDDVDDDTGLSAFEATPAPVSNSAGTIFTQVVASDSGGFAVTDDGFVCGWGTFRNGEGKNVFSIDRKTGRPTVEFQLEPARIDGLKDIKKLAAGANHILALDKKGNVYAFGNSDQGQTGRRPIRRRQWDTLTPTTVALPKGNKIVNIFAHGDNSFAIDRAGKVYAWGANSSAQAGIKRNAGQPEACIFKPEIITALPSPAAMVAGGATHTAVATQAGDVYIWGKATDGLMGFTDLPTENLAYTDSGKGSMLLVPTRIPDLPAVSYIAANTRQNIAITRGGDAYSWGTNDSYEAGQGMDNDTVEVATKMSSKQIEGKKLVVAGAGAGWGFVASEA